MEYDSICKPAAERRKTRDLKFEIHMLSTRIICSCSNPLLAIIGGV
jgi:hypothetical protein